MANHSSYNNLAVRVHEWRCIKLSSTLVRHTVDVLCVCESTDISWNVKFIARPTTNRNLLCFCAERQKRECEHAYTESKKKINSNRERRVEATKRDYQLRERFTAHENVTTRREIATEIFMYNCLNACLLRNKDERIYWSWKIARTHSCRATRVHKNVCL